jgi:glycosyltransferase involved in cell wall biosynthesis
MSENLRLSPQGDPGTIALVTTANIQPFERIARWLARGFDEIGVPFDVVFVDRPLPGRKTSSREIILGSARSRYSIRRLWRVLSQTRPRLVLAAPGHVSPVVAIAARVAGVPSVPWIGSFVRPDVALERGPIRALPALERATYRFGSGVACVSRDVCQYARDEFPQLGNDRVFLLPNPVDAEEVQRLSKARDAIVPTAPFTMCAVGALVWQKGFDLLIEAFAVARAALPTGCELVIAGDGPLRRDLEKLASERNVGAAVRFIGRVDNPYAVVASADVFVHAARREGFGVAITEALTLGVPVIATACPGGPRDILRGGAGLLVPPEEVQPLADALVEVAGSSSLRSSLRQKGYARSLEYSPARIAEAVLDIADRI